MNPEIKALKSVRRAKKNYLKALRNLEKVRGQVVTSLNIHRTDIISDNEYGVETKLDFIDELVTDRDSYLSEASESRFINGWHLHRHLK